MIRHYKPFVPYLFLIPAGIVLLVFFFIPFFESFLLSFQSYRHNIYSPEWVGLANYVELFSSPVFYKTMINTFIYLVVAVPVLVVLPLIIAIFVNQKLRGVSIYRTLIYIPVIVSIVVAGIAWKWLYASNGILNYIISLLNLPAIGWLTDPNVALYSVIVVTVWKGIGYYMVIYMAALTAVPRDLYEAADIDGANEVHKHIAVTIPYLKPTIALVSIISSISAMKVFVEIYVMTNGGPMNASKTIVYYIYQRAFENLELGYASAAGVVLLIIVMILSIINMKFFEGDKTAQIV
ncbi:MAG: lactose ABC transporter permease [Candidatus Melainabacteria bacterium RIFOXYA12_FULL_32_12]|nr:MAG: lactose ABC transporter permease [Candidatus Melainabacteria bacterium RIFOXYA12_FULL_32_12]